MTLTNEQKRQQSGRDMEEARRASGRKMRDDMRALAENNRLERTLPVLPIRGNQPAKRGSAVWQGGPTSTGAGVASPLSEIGAENSREYFNATPVRVFSPDYMVAIEIQPLKTLRMTDANNEPVVMQFRNPFVME